MRAASRGGRGVPLRRRLQVRKGKAELRETPKEVRPPPPLHSPPPPSHSPPPSVALVVCTTLSVSSTEDGELVLWGAARCAAADDHQGERTVLSLAHEDEEPAGPVHRLGQVKYK